MKDIVEFENFNHKFESIVKSPEWQKVEELYTAKRTIYMFGNGGNMGVTDHAAVDMSRLTNKNVLCPGSGITATSIIGDNSFDIWFKVWLEQRFRTADLSDSLVIAFSCSTNSDSSKSIMNALEYAIEMGVPAILIAAVPKDDLNPKIIFINQDTIYYHTSEVLSLALTYQLIHAAGFQCPTISKKARSRRFDKLEINNEISHNTVPPGMEEERNNLAIDFDGVIHNFDKGWYDGTCYGEPIEGSIEALKKLSEKYNIIIFTGKALPDRPLVNGKTGKQLITEWMEKYNLLQYIDNITYSKPRAEYYIDDKGIFFNNNWEEILNKIL
jgi:phosphoheptose isomerase